MPEPDSSDVARKRAPKGGIRIGGKFFQGGTLLPRPENVAKYRREQRAGRVSIDPASRTPGAPPNFGRPTAPHIFTFMGVTGSMAKTYRNPDEAIKHAIDNARIMRNDCSVMECLEARQRVTALLNWHLEPEDKKSQKQKELCDRLTSIIKLIPQFTEYRRNLLEALWFGRYAVENIYGVDYSTGKRRFTVNRWVPRHGDKLVFRYDDGSGKYDPDEVGIRVGTTLTKEDHIAGRRILDYADIGLCYFLEPWERTRLTLHKHIIEDAAFEDPTNAGSIHGVGIRSRIYWTWFQKQETLAQLMELVERTGNGFTIYYYPTGNDEARQQIEEVAKQQAHTNVILMPFDFGNPDGYRVEQIPPNTAGIEALRSMVHEHFGHQIKRYILGQTLSTESDATGLGSGVADLHDRSLNQIARYDATKLEETITTELVTPLKNFNEPAARNIRVLFKIDTESPDAEKKLEAYRQAYDMGCKIRAQDVMDLIGAGIPSGDEEVLQNPQIQQQQRLWARQMGDEDPSMGGGNTPPDSPEALFGTLAQELPEDQIPYSSLPKQAAYKAQRAPEGGVNVQGQFYPGGQWIPSEVVDAATPEERAAIGADDTGDQDPPAESQSPEEQQPAGEPSQQPGQGDQESDSGPLLADRQKHAAAQLGAVHKPIGGLMRAIHASPEFAESGTFFTRDVHPNLAEDIYGWMAENAGQEAGGGRVIDLGNGRLGFSSGAGAMVVAPTEKGDWQVSYTVQTQLVAQSMAGEVPVAQPPGEVDTETEPDTAIEPEEPAQQPSAPSTSGSGSLPKTDKPIRPDRTPKQPKPTAPPIDPGRFLETAAQAEQRYDQAIRAYDEAMRTGGDTRALRKAVSQARTEWREAERIARDVQRRAKQAAKANPANPFTSGSASERKMAVKRALAEGRQVPPDVLARYPELNRQPDDDFDEGTDVGGQGILPVGDKPGPRSSGGAAATAPKPRGVDKLKAHLKHYIAASGLDIPQEMLSQVQDAIERGAIKSPGQMRRAMQTARKLHERGDLSAEGSAAVKESLRRAINRSERPNRRQLISQTSSEHGIDERDLTEAVEYLWDEKRKSLQDRESAKEAARLATGLTAGDIAKFENQGLDYSSDHPKLRSLDVVGRSLAGEFPGLFGGSGYSSETGSDDTDYAAVLWEMLREGRGKMPSRHDPELIREAAEFLLSSGDRSKSYMTPEQEAELASLPFRRRGIAIQYRAKSSLLRMIETEAAETDPNPSPAQKAAGNFAKGKLRLHGLQIAIETPRGAIRSGTDPNGNPWSIKMPHHYGYICRTKSDADGDQVDVFLGPDPDSEVVFVVDQVDGAGKFDEHKVMLGWLSEAEAVKAYASAYSENWKIGPVTAMTIHQFRAWLEDGDSARPAAEQVSRYARKKPLPGQKDLFDEREHPRNEGGKFTNKTVRRPERDPGGLQGPTEDELSDMDMSRREVRRVLREVSEDPNNASTIDLRRAMGQLSHKIGRIRRRLDEGSLTLKQAREQIDSIQREKQHLQTIIKRREHGEIVDPEHLTRAEKIAEAIVFDERSLEQVAELMEMNQQEISEIIPEIQKAVKELREFEDESGYAEYAKWDESKYDRVPKGNPGGGQFAPKGQAATVSVKIDPDAFGQDLSAAEIRKAAYDFAMQNLRKEPFINRQTGKKIKVSRKGIDEVLHRSADLRRAIGLFYLPQMLEEATYVQEELPQSAESPYKKYHRFEVNVEFSGQPNRVDMLVGEDANGDWFYHYNFFGKKEGPASKKGDE